ncbi:MAG TPA: hypothetical protein DCX07_06340 [Phycisphaerales bacterium]|nr:hypothetical protein [Phycisphaerales bacterium]
MTDLAKLHTDVVFGRAGGRIIWQPRIQCWYHDKKFAGEPLPKRYEGMSLPDIYRDLGCSDRLYSQYNPCFRRIEPEGVRRVRRELNATDVETTIETPVGKQVRIDRRTPNSPRAIRVKWPVESEDELKVAAWIEENTTWEWDEQKYQQSLREVGDLGAPTMYLPRMNVQDLYINTMGVEKGIFALYDWTETVEAYFRALERSHDRLIDVVCACPIEIINYGENVHSGTLSPDIFQKYHLPACLRRSEKLHAAGKFVCSHWDGDCRPLLRFARQTGLDGIEAITPIPQGDVTLEETREALGDEMFLLDGIPAIYFDKTFPVETLVECTRKLIELFAPRLVLGISDELSSTGDIERVRVVGDIVAEYNAKFA